MLWAGSTLFRTAMATTIPDVYIIETLSPDDEGNGRFEGAFLSHVLRLHDKNPKYTYVRTLPDFKQAVRAFSESSYRYLHLSCHGDAKGLCTTNLDDIDYGHLAEMLIPHMKGKRLFISACKMVHEDLAAALIPRSGCFSVVGPTENIAFTDSAVIWAAIYHLALSEDSGRIKRDSLQSKLKQACGLFDVSFAFFAKSKQSKKGYSVDLLA